MSSPSATGGPAVSCDACRKKKVKGKNKCIRHDRGDCQRCRHTGVQCVTNRKRAPRPYYQTTKEQFKLMAAIVHHFLPGVTLDKDQLRNAVHQLQSRGTPAPTIQEDDPLASRIPGATLRIGDEAPWPIPNCAVEAQESFTEYQTFHTEGYTPVSTGVNPGTIPNVAETRLDPSLPLNVSRSQEDDHDSEPPPDREPSESVKSRDRCMLPSPSSISSDTPSADQGSLILCDAAQVPRYYNKTCYKTFCSIMYSSFKSSAHSQLFDAQPPIDSYPLDGKSNMLVVPDDLPSQSSISEAAQKFFAEINNTTYIVNYHHFKKHLRDVYDTGTAASNATLAIIHLIGFLGTSDSRLFIKGVRHCNASVEEGSLESVQAIMLMTFGYMLRGQINTAWISLGSAIRIAQSLGLHSHELVWGDEPGHTVETKKRLWWSLFDLDITLSSIMGRPPSVDKDLVYTSVPQDLDFEPNAFTPPGYSKASAELALLHSEVIRKLYLRPINNQDSGGLTENLLNRLQEWWDILPLYLKPGCPAAPSYIRAITYLGLRYYYSLTLITQPYLLKSISGNAVFDEQLAQKVVVCEKANIEAIILMKELINQNLTRKLNFFDAFHILSHGIILCLRSVKCQSPEIIDELDRYVSLLSLADHLVIGKFGKESIKALLLKLRNKQSNGQEEAWSRGADPQTSQVLFDTFEVADFQWLDNFGIDVTNL